MGLNPVYFSVLFKKETGINVSAYLLNVRMEKAKEFFVIQMKLLQLLVTEWDIKTLDISARHLRSKWV